MDCGACYARIPAIDALPAAVKCQRVRSSFVQFALVGGLPKIRRLSFADQCFSSRASSRSRAFVITASAESSKCDFRSVSTPLEPRSSAGQFLSGILKDHRHLFPFAVAQQLEALASDRDGAIARHISSEGTSESCLHGKIAEMKEQECRIAIEEVLYLLIVHKFSEIEVPMVPRLLSFISNGRLEILASKERELESIHGIETLEMIRQHLSTILGCRGKSDISDNWSTKPFRRLQLGRVYAASIMYGYFLKSASLRHQLEQNLALSHHHLPFGCMMHRQCAENETQRVLKNHVLDRSSRGSPSLFHSSGRSKNTQTLLEYVTEFDSETLQRCAKLKSLEVVNLIEKHTWALFGDDDDGGDSSDEMVYATLLSLRRLVLEAVAFGSFLWDVEQYVGSIYRLTES